MRRAASTYINTIVYKTDTKSLKRVKDEAEKLRKEFEKSSPTQIKKVDALRNKTLKDKQKLLKQDRISRKIAIESSKKELKALEKINKEQQKSEDFHRRKKIKADSLLHQKRFDKLPEITKKVARNNIMSAKSNVELAETMQKQRNLLTRQVGLQKKQNILQRRFNASLGQTVGQLGSVFAAYQGVISVMETGKEFEGITKGLTTVFGSTSKAKDEMQFLRKEAERLGVPITDLARGYMQLAASTQGVLKGDLVRKLFSSFTTFGSATGASASQMSLAMYGLQQMASQHSMQTPEFNQINEALPGFKQRLLAAAKAAKMIGEKDNWDAFKKLMQDGKALTSKILPALSREMDRFVVDSGAKIGEGLNPTIGRATNALQTFKLNILDSGMQDGLIFILKSFKEITKAVEGSEKSTNNLATFIGGFFQSAVATLAYTLQVIPAILEDTKNFMVELTGVTREREDSFMRLTSSVLGVAAALGILYKGIKLLKGAKNLIGGLTGGSNQTIGGSHGRTTVRSKYGLGVQRVYVVNMGSNGMNGGSDMFDSKNKGSSTSSLVKAAAVGLGAAGATALALNALDYKPKVYDTIGSPNPIVSMLGAAFLRNTYGGMFNSTPNNNTNANTSNSINVIVKPSDELGHVVTAKIEDANNKLVDDSLSEMMGSGV